VSLAVGEQLLDLAQQALERMAFLIADPADQVPIEVLPECRYAARIGIRGGRQPGWLVVAVSAPFAADVAAGLLGCEAAAVDLACHGDAAAAELANVFGGQLVMALGGDRQPWRLGLPEVLVGSDAALLVAGAEWSGVLRGEQGCLVLACGFDGPPGGMGPA
jgi:cobalamin biosynthesis protein CbiG